MTGRTEGGPADRSSSDGTIDRSASDIQQAAAAVLDALEQRLA